MGWLCDNNLVVRAKGLLERAFTMMENIRRETFGKYVYIVKHFHPALYMHFRFFDDRIFS